MQWLRLSAYTLVCTDTGSCRGCIEAVRA